jgi:membrane protein YqaA with SNARE-associated domain
MKELVAWIQTAALALGGPGLFLVAFLDASFLSLPQINDLLLVWMVTRNPHLMPFYATMSVTGSVLGCAIMYLIGQKGGDAVLRKRFKGSAVERGMALIARYGVLTVMVPALLPPPAPFKIFVLLAGAARIGLLKFCVAIAVARAIRYFGEGLLAVWYGKQALDFIDQNGRTVSLGLVGAILVGALGYMLWRRLRGGKPAAGADTEDSAGGDSAGAGL